MLDSPKRDRKSERRSATRSEILQAAWDVSRENGLAGLSLREVGRRVGLQAPSLYAYFGSKNDLYDAMYAQGCTEFVEGQPSMPADVVEGVRAIMRYYVDFCTADPARHQLLFQRTIPGFIPSATSFAIAVESLDTLVRWFAEAGLGGWEAVDLYTAVGSGLAAQQNANDPGGDRWTRLVDQAADMFVTYAQQHAPTTGQEDHP